MARFGNASPLRRLGPRAVGAALAALTALCVSLAVVPAASANFQWLGSGSGEFPNGGGVKLEAGPKGLAVNLATGDLYEADGNNNRVLRFDAEGKFVEAWGFGVGNGEPVYERCGPALALKTCPGREGRENAWPGEGEGEFKFPESIAVDQASGNVFVLSPDRKKGVIQEFSADGALIGNFGVLGNEGGEQLEAPIGTGAIAVDPSGRADVVDSGTSQTHNPGGRVVVFAPQAPGAYAFEKEILRGHIKNVPFLDIDSNGNLYVSEGEALTRFNLAGEQTWRKEVVEVAGVTIDPGTGALFYFDAKANKFHKVKPVGTSGGEEELFEGAKGQKEAASSAFSPNFAVPGRPSGILYADDEFVPTTKQASRGLIFAPSAESPPTVRGEAVESVGVTFAALGAEVNPQGFDTRYFFEYGSQPCSLGGCAKAPLVPVDIGSGTTDQKVSAAVSGLSPSTTYHFRVVAENQFALTGVAGADAEFTTFPAISGLPDHRAYELVSPAEKHGGEVFPLDADIGSCHGCEPGKNAKKMPEQSAPDGESILYEGYPFSNTPEGGTGAVNENEYLAARTPSGWETTDLSLERQAVGQGRGFRAFSPDLTTGILAQSEPTLAPEALAPGIEDYYLRDAAGALTPLLRTGNTGGGLTSSLLLEFGGASADYSRLLIEANASLTPGSPLVSGGENNLYEWAGGQLRLVSIREDGTASSTGGVFGSGKTLEQTESAPDITHAISNDGTRIFWSKPPSEQVFVRIEGTHTVKIADKGAFLAASGDGEEVLLNDGHIYNVDTESIVDLTHAKKGFLGILGATEDLTHVYFVDSANLSAGESPGHRTAIPGQPNLYAYEGVPNELRFLGTLSPADNNLGVAGLIGAWKAAPSDRLAQVTPDGRFLVFDSHASLTGFHNEIAEPCGPTADSNACREVFEYDAQEGTLTCVSCNPTGMAPRGQSFLSLLHPVGSRFPQPRNLTDDGRVFFDSFDSLTADDVMPGVENVFEFERDGQGTCEREDGCLTLLSSGRSSLDASFFSADETGRNVFITTRAQLVPEDHDELVDLYDAREGGGFSRVSPPAPCTGEGCRPPAPGPPPAPGAASSVFSGPGNATPPPSAGVKGVSTKKPARCPKGKVRKHGRCVKSHKRHGRKATARRSSSQHGSRRP